jgi:hypothetical protein
MKFLNALSLGHVCLFVYVAWTVWNYVLRSLFSLPLSCDTHLLQVELVDQSA